MDRPDHARRTAERLESLLDRALDTLEAILNDPSVSAEARADLALRLVALGAAGAPASAQAAAGETLLPMQFVSIPDFLPPELHAQAVETALRLRDRFEPSTITTDEPDFRRSDVVYDTAFPELREAVLREIEPVLPAVFTGLARTPFAPSHIEMQLSAHGEGDYFRMHSDAASPEIAAREITFVYYFMLRRPRGFSGGTLRLFQTWNGAPPCAERDQFHDIEPTDNSIVFFDSRLMHEVQPLQVPSRAFEDGRFTLNGWLRR